MDQIAGTHRTRKSHVTRSDMIDWRDALARSHWSTSDPIVRKDMEMFPIPHCTDNTVYKSLFLSCAASTRNFHTTRGVLNFLKVGSCPRETGNRQECSLSMASPTPLPLEWIPEMGVVGWSQQVSSHHAIASNFCASTWIRDSCDLAFILWFFFLREVTVSFLKLPKEERD